MPAPLLWYRIVAGSSCPCRDCISQPPLHIFCSFQCTVRSKAFLFQSKVFKKGFAFYTHLFPLSPGWKWGPQMRKEPKMEGAWLNHCIESHEYLVYYKSGHKKGFLFSQSPKDDPWISHKKSFFFSFINVTTQLCVQGW